MKGKRIEYKRIEETKFYTTKVFTNTEELKEKIKAIKEDNSIIEAIEFECKIIKQ